MAVNGTAVAAIGGGTLLLYAGLKGKSVLGEARAIITGKPPASAAAANQITSSGSGTSTTTGVVTGTIPSSSSARQALQQAAASHGWGSGAQWQALQSLEMGEAGFDPTAENASGAYGIAQSLGHPYPGGPAPNGINEYNGEGLTAAESEQASMGAPGPQAVWMCNYIASRYGNPVTAYNTWLSRNPHWY